MTEKKVPPPPPSSQNSDPSAKAEPGERIPEDGIEIELDQEDPVIPSASAVPGGSTKGSQKDASVPARSEKGAIAFGKKILDLFMNIAKGGKPNYPGLSLFVSDEANESTLARLAHMAQEGGVGEETVSKLALVAHIGMVDEAIASKLAQIVRDALEGGHPGSAKGSLSAEPGQLSFEDWRGRIEGVIEVDDSQLIPAEPVPLVVPLVDERGNPMRAVVERNSGGSPVIVERRSPTPPPLPSTVLKPVVGNRFLKVVQALPEDFRAQYVLALIERIRESISDVNIEASSPEENVQKIQAIGWVANEWKNDPGIPSEFIMKLIKNIESNFIPALAERELIALLNEKDYENFDKPLEELRTVIAERCMDRLDPEGKDQIRKIRAAFATGDESEGNRIMRHFFNSAESFHRMGKEGYQGLSQRNFMSVKETPSPLVEYFWRHELKGLTEQKARLRVLELGPGIGNDAMWWVKMKGVVQYLGIDANPMAVKMSNERFKELNAKGLSGKAANAVMGNFVDHLETIQRNGNKDFLKNDKRFRTIVVGISVLHYLAVEEREFRRVLGIIRDIIAPTRGRLVMATKTPRADTCRLHTIVRKEGGRVIGISRPEKVARAFMEREYLVRMLKEAGFDMENSTLLKQIMKEYDFPGLDEEFECVIAQAKE